MRTKLLLVAVIGVGMCSLMGLQLFGPNSKAMISPQTTRIAGPLAADGLRAFLLLKLDVFALIVLRRIHRRRFAEYQFGTGKLERLVNVTVGLGMYAAVLWILFSALDRLEAQPPPASALSVALGIAFADANLCLNVYGLFRVYRAHRAAPSIIMRTQHRSRLAMAISSSIVFAVVLASASVSDPTAGNLLDVLGSAFVSAVILWIGASMVRESLPDLLDKSIDPRAQRLVLQTLAEHFDDYDDLIEMRSRRSGQEAFVDIELGFATMPRSATSRGAAAPSSRTCAVFFPMLTFAWYRWFRTGPEPSPCPGMAPSGSWRNPRCRRELTRCAPGSLHFAAVGP